MQDFTKLGLDRQLRSTNSIINKMPKVTRALDFAVSNQPYMRNMNAGFINVPNLIQFSNVASASGQITTGATFEN